MSVTGGALDRRIAFRGLLPIPADDPASATDETDEYKNEDDYEYE